MTNREVITKQKPNTTHRLTTKQERHKYRRLDTSGITQTHKKTGRTRTRVTGIKNYNNFTYNLNSKKN